MLIVYRSNRAEWLANVLAEQLRLYPPEIFQSVEVVVSSWPTGRWLSEEIANINGITALVRFPFPNSYFRKLVASFLGYKVEISNEWESNNLVWHILNLLPELLDREESAELKKWIIEKSSSDNDIDKNKWQLAKNIANTLEEYDLYRPEIISQWWIDSDVYDRKDNELPANVKWQPILVKLLKDKLETEPFSIQIMRVIDAIKKNTFSIEGLPSSISLFGLNSLSPLQIKLIQALSKNIDIKIYLITPCKDLWQRHVNRRTNLEENLQAQTEGKWLLNASRLEATLGKMGSEFEQLLEGTGEYQLGESAEQDLFAMPVDIARNNNSKPSILEYLQQQLVINDEFLCRDRDPLDSSIQFIDCPGKRREVEIIRDQLLQWMSQDSTLEPQDILIMTPQVENYSPFVTSVFNDISSIGIKLPWKIADRSQQSKPGIMAWVIELLDIASNNINASNLDIIISHSIVRNAYNLSYEDINRITTSLQKVGFRSGLDKSVNNGNRVHTLEWSLQRLLIGVILPSNPEYVVDDISPFNEDISFEDLSNWWKLLSNIFNYLSKMRTPRLCREWVELLKSIVKEMFKIESELSWDYDFFASILDEWLSTVGDNNLKIESAVVSDILKGVLSRKSGRFGHRTGNITISALEPMRAIPHKIIIIMGIDESVFPRRKKRNGFSLIHEKHYIGDPNVSDKDRYSLLEAVISARSKLMITWNGRNEKSGEITKPGNPIQQLIQYLKNELGEESFKGMLRVAPASSTDEKNFIKSNTSNPLSCDSKYLKARQILNENHNHVIEAIGMPLSWDMNTLERKDILCYEDVQKWLIKPQLTWLTNKKLYPNQSKQEIKDIESLDLNELDKYTIINNILMGIIDKQVKAQFKLEDIDLVYEYQGRGILPPKSQAIIETNEIKKRIESLYSLLTSYGCLYKDKINIEGEEQEILMTDNAAIIFDIGKSKVSSFLKGWLIHLQICMNEKCSENTIYLSRHESASKKHTYKVSQKWKIIEKEEAKDVYLKVRHLAARGFEECWPVPPSSGFRYAIAEKNDLDKARVIFKESWEGNYRKKGECEKEEMKLCFGRNTKSDLFLNEPIFHQCIHLLYNPIIKYSLL